MTGTEASARDAAVREAIAGIAAAGTPDAVADRLEPVATSLFESDVAVVYRYDEDEEAFASVARTEAADADPSPVTAGDDPEWAAFSGERPAVVSSGEARSLVVPVPDAGALRIEGVEPPSIGGRDVALAGALAPIAVGVADRERRLEERAETVADLRRENEQLRDFADIVSHDLRNPLSVARGFLELAVEEGDEEYVRKIEEAHDRIEGIVEHTLALAREGERVGDTLPVDVETVARRAWSVVETPDAALEVLESPIVDADPDRLQQSLENLFRNAVEHGSTSPRSPEAHEDAVEHGSTSPGSSSTRQDAVEHGVPEGAEEGPAADGDGPAVTVRVGATPEGFYVEDDGEGIPEEERDRVFERGYSGEAGGTGIGLGTVRDVVEAHGWSIDLVEGEEGGARFEIRTEE